MSELLHFSERDEDRTSLFGECTDNYGVGEETSEWPSNLLSAHLESFASGFITKTGSGATHTVVAQELQRCRELAGQACAVMDGVEVGMGSESEDYFSPFYIAATAGCPAASVVDEALIREAFGGTIFPPATITVEPLAERGTWWQEILADFEDEDPDELQEQLGPWRALIRWFSEQPALSSAVFVRIGDYDELEDLEELPDGTEMVGSVMPRLAVALTESGSLVGVFGQSVQT